MALLVQHILRHPSGRVSFRRQYPPELRPFIPGPNGTGPTVLKVSLGQEGTPGFLSRYEAAMEQWEATVFQARKRKAGAFDPLDAPLIAYLAETFLVEMLEQDDAARWSLEERQLYHATKATLETHGVSYRPPWADAEGRRWALKARESLEASLPEYRRLKAEGDLDGIVDEWRDEALDLAEARGLTVNPDDAEGLARLCRALNDAAIRASQDRLRRLNGEDVPTPPEPVRQVCQSASKKDPLSACKRDPLRRAA
jgi:hypothetical protein